MGVLVVIRGPRFYAMSRRVAKVRSAGYNPARVMGDGVTGRWTMWARGVLAAAVIAATCLLVDFAHASRLGLLADDWTILGDLVLSESTSPLETIEGLLLHSWEARPLRAVEYLALWQAYELAGFTGAFLVMGLTLSASGVVFAWLVRRRLPLTCALLAGLLFVLHPADTTHVWACTLMAKLGILYALLACVAFVRGRYLLAGAGCLAALLSYELSVFPFVLAAWFRDGGSRRSAAATAAVLVSALGVYGLWRLEVFPWLAPDIRSLGVEQETFDPDHIGAYALAIAKTPIAMLVTGPWRAAPLAFERHGRDALVLAAAGFAALAGILALGWRRQASAGAANGVTAKDLGRAAAWAVAAMLAGNALVFVVPVNTSIEIASRHTIAAVPGAALFLTIAFTAAWRLAPSRAKPVVAIACVAVLATAAGIRHRIVHDYVEAARYQRRIIRECVETLGPLPPHTMVVIIHPRHAWNPPRRRAIEPFVTGFSFESEAIFRLVYDESVIGLTLETEEDYALRALGGPGLQIHDESPRFHSALVYDARTSAVQWLYERKLDPGEEKVPPRGPAARLVLADG